MRKIYFICFLILISIQTSLNLGINNYEKTENFYIIDISSDDLAEFLHKLEWYLNNVKKEFISYFIKAGILLLFIIIVLKLCLKINLGIILVSTFLLSIKTLAFKYNDFQSGIRSANNAINNFYLAMNVNKIHAYDSIDSDEEKEIYIGDEIKQYGLHATFCEIPGTLPSQKAKKESYSYLFGGLCYEYSSQRRFVDKTHPSYPGDEISKKYKDVKVQNIKHFLE